MERKSGHIVAVSSIAGKVSIPHCVVYCASKFGVTGLMSALYDELCALGHDEFIKTTTIYPGLVATRKDLLEIIGDIPILHPDDVAKATVDGILKNQRNIFAPHFLKYLLVVE